MPQENNTNDITTINVTAKPGDSVEIENQNGPTKIRILVVRYDQEGGAQRREVDAGATVSDVVGDVNEHQDVTVNGLPAAADQELEDGNKVAVTPDNPEGGRR